ncbi:hypothetical protein GC167_01580 [bacterium]|nr:hypothetical protein [bacterium]
MFSLESEWERAFAKRIPFSPEVLVRREVFRGDSFQALIIPEYAFRVALYLRAWMWARTFGHPTHVRIGMGLGSIDVGYTRMAHGRGAAFEGSGQAPDNLGKGRLAFDMGADALSLWFSQLGTAVDAFVRKWDALDAQLWLGRWPYVHTQTSLAEELGITQSAVSQRMLSAQFDGLEALCALYPPMLRCYLAIP